MPLGKKVGPLQAWSEFCLLSLHIHTLYTHLNAALLTAHARIPLKKAKFAHREYHDRSWEEGPFVLRQKQISAKNDNFLSLRENFISTFKQNYALRIVHWIGLALGSHLRVSPPWQAVRRRGETISPEPTPLLCTGLFLRLHVCSDHPHFKGKAEH